MSENKFQFFKPDQYKAKFNELLEEYKTCKLLEISTGTCIKENQVSFNDLCYGRQIEFDDGRLVVEKLRGNRMRIERKAPGKVTDELIEDLVKDANEFEESITFVIGEYIYPKYDCIRYNVEFFKKLEEKAYPLDKFIFLDVISRGACTREIIDFYVERFGEIRKPIQLGFGFGFIECMIESECPQELIDYAQSK
jgi:hypothetical protein